MAYGKGRGKVQLELGGQEFRWGEGRVKLWVKVDARKEHECILRERFYIMHVYLAPHCVAFLSLGSPILADMTGGSTQTFGGGTRLTGRRERVALKEKLMLY